METWCGLGAGFTEREVIAIAEIYYAMLLIF